jgi:hypothetical protein
MIGGRMRRTWSAASTVLLAGLLAGCGVQPTGVTEAGRAPTGIAPGPTLYVVDAHGRLRPQPQQSINKNLGTIAEAMSLLLTVAKGDQLYTKGGGPTVVFVNITPGVIHLTVPLARDEVTSLGIDQIVCTALGVWVQSGGPKTTWVQVEFIQPTPESAVLRACPLIR